MTVVDDSVATRLLRSSARHSYDPEVDLDWDAPEVEGLWWMQPERVSLYGTELWDALTLEQQVELSRHEVGSIVHMGWWFEVILMRGLLREAYRSDPRSARTHYLLTEVADECRHSTMFGRAMTNAGVPAYGPPPRLQRLADWSSVVLHGPSLYAGALLVEETLDRWQRESMHDERVQPLTRMVNRIHVMEEARHVTFARDELTKSVAGLSRLGLIHHQAVMGQVAYGAMRCLINPQAYAAVGIDPSEGRRTAMANPTYQATLRWMGEKVMPFLQENRMVARPHLKWWRGSFLL